MGFHGQLDLAWRTSGSLLCVGLDPDPARMPEPLDGANDAAFRFCKEIVDATADVVCAYKPQVAYFASQRAEAELERLCIYIRETYPDVALIVDAKRGDIGSTAEHYARELFGRYHAHAATVNPYLGLDSVLPYFDHDGGVIALCRTSNPGGDDLQSLDCGGRPLYVRVAEMVATTWSEHGECGLVVGATYPEELGVVRDVVGDLPDSRSGNRRPGWRRSGGCSCRGHSRWARSDDQLIAVDPVRQQWRRFRRRGPGRGNRSATRRHSRRVGDVVTATMGDAIERRARFRAMHAAQAVFVMPNPWDAGSAKLLASAGFTALATTSAGLAWSLGKDDQSVTRDELIQHVRQITGVTDLPLNVDSERCYGDDSAGIIETVELLRDAGAAGCSIEDYDPATDAIDPIDLATERVAFAVSATRNRDGDDLVLTARCENFLYGVTDLDDTIKRLRSLRRCRRRLRVRTRPDHGCSDPHRRRRRRRARQRACPTGRAVRRRDRSSRCAPSLDRGLTRQRRLRGDDERSS